MTNITFKNAIDVDGRSSQNPRDISRTLSKLTLVTGSGIKTYNNPINLIEVLNTQLLYILVYKLIKLKLLIIASTNCLYVKLSNAFW